MTHSVLLHLKIGKVIFKLRVWYEVTNICCLLVWQYCQLIFDCLVGLAVASATAEQGVLGSIQSVIGFFHQGFLSNIHGVWMCARLMAIGSPPITWDLET